MEGLPSKYSQIKTFISSKLTYEIFRIGKNIKGGFVTTKFGGIKMGSFSNGFSKIQNF